MKELTFFVVVGGVFVCFCFCFLILYFLYIYIFLRPPSLDGCIRANRERQIHESNAQIFISSLQFLLP